VVDGRPNACGSAAASAASHLQKSNDLAREAVSWNRLLGGNLYNGLQLI
jgi:hypothetical protein